MSGEAQAKLIVSLLRQTTSLQVVSEFLKAKGVPHSTGSWDDLYVKRIQPALDSHAITVADLIALLRSVEESGRQHVFLFQTQRTKAQEAMEQARVRKALEKRGIDHVIDSPKVLDQPRSPTISDVRWDAASENLRMTIKSVEQRTYHKFLGETDKGNTLIREYEAVRERAVNVVRLHRDGLLELRIASHTNSSKYAEDVTAMWKQLDGVLDESDFSLVSLQKAKDRLWKDRDKLSQLVRYSDSVLRNDQGTVLKAATGEMSASLIDDAGAVGSLNEFMRHDAVCDATNIWFLAKDPAPSRDIHVLLSGQVNEFAITAHCIPADYEYVLGQLRTLNS